MNNFKIQLRKRNIPEEELLGDIKRVALFFGKNSITAKEYEGIGSFGVNTFIRKFGGWNVALEKAGLAAPHKQNITDENLFLNIADVWTHLGRQPYGREMDKSNLISKFSLGTYEHRFGSWNGALIRFSEYINSDSVIEPRQKLMTGTPRSIKRTPRNVNWRLRAQVLIRDNCICQMCGASPSKNPEVNLHADHIHPYSKGGETVFENLRTLCAQCNIGKSDMVGDEISS